MENVFLMAGFVETGIFPSLVRPTTTQFRRMTFSFGFPPKSRLPAKGVFLLWKKVMAGDSQVFLPLFS